jgi:hypothetical protein
MDASWARRYRSMADLKAHTDITAVEANLAARGGLNYNYNLTGPQALTFTEAADIIATVSGRPIAYNDVGHETGSTGVLPIGVPADDTVMLRWLTSALATRNGAWIARRLTCRESRRRSHSRRPHRAPVSVSSRSTSRFRNRTSAAQSSRIFPEMRCVSGSSLLRMASS